MAVLELMRCALGKSVCIAASDRRIHFDVGEETMRDSFRRQASPRKWSRSHALEQRAELLRSHAPGKR